MVSEYRTQSPDTSRAAEEFQMEGSVVFVTHSLHEALALSTRVVVMTARPGRVKSVLDLPMPYPRAMESRDMVALRAGLWAEIRDESLRAMGER
jgi:NitT/TauT family transport system ATP-binding protein